MSSVSAHRCTFFSFHIPLFSEWLSVVSIRMVCGDGVWWAVMVWGGQ